MRLKPSGVEWLGDVPEHWRIVRLGRLIGLITGFPFKSEGFSQSDSDRRLLRGINVAPGRVRWDSVVRWPMSDVRLYADFEMRPGDIVLGMDRPIVSAGVRVAEVTADDVPSLLLQRVARIRPREELDPSFALLLLGGKSFSDYMSPIFTGISVPHISPDQIGEFRVALPTKAEQATIVRFLKEATANIVGAVDRAEREISLLREYRARLVAEVVTGQLDVRDAAGQFPDEPMADEEGFPADDIAAADAAEVGEAEPEATA